MPSDRVPSDRSNSDRSNSDRVDGGRHALVVGAGIAGPAAAHWLQRAGWRVTIVEQAPGLRDGGQNVDVHGPGRDVVERMGLLDAVRQAGTGEEGLEFVDDRGRSLARFPAGRGSWTQELEILRGDLSRLLARAAEPAEFRFGDTVVALDEQGGRVRVSFEHAAPEEFDVVVGADGLGSQVRRLVLGDLARVDDLGLEIAWATVPRQPQDVDWWRWYSIPGGSVQLRPDPHGTMRTMLTRTLGVGVDPSHDLPREQQLAAFRETLSGGGWETARVLDAVAQADDLYVEAVAQVHAPRWSSGRVVLLGDAAHCASPVSGMGTSLALAGAHVLAGELAGDDVPAALARYERVLRPFVEKAQGLPPGVPRVANPRTRAGVVALRTAVRLAGSRPARALAGRFGGGGDDEGFTLPDYPALAPR